MSYLHRNSYNHNGEDQSTKCPVPKHLRKQQGKNHGRKKRKKPTVKSIHGKLDSSQVSYTNVYYHQVCGHRLVTTNHHEKARRIQHKLLEKKPAYDKSKINNPQVIFLLGSKQITTKATWNMKKVQNSTMKW